MREAKKRCSFPYFVEVPALNSQLFINFVVSQQHIK